MTVLPRDKDNKPIPVLCPDGAAHKITTSGSSARNSTPFSADTRAVRLTASQDCWIKFGDVTVTATNSDHFLLAGVPADFGIGGSKRSKHTHVAALQVTSGGTLYVSEYS